jgi:HAD superfamily hydrolase (TIGR01484 family)
VYFLALAADYDGTLAQDGVVADSTIAALEQFKATGRRVLVVTGRELDDLRQVFERIDVCDCVVAENGALLYNPSTGEERALVSPPPAIFVDALKQRQISPLSVGRAIVATWEPNEAQVLAIIRDLGLELQIIFNKGAVMVLPTGMNKAVGLRAALDDLELSAHNVVGVGDAENDHSFLRVCGCSAAVANALPSVKEHADIRLQGERGEGVAELLTRICREDGAIIPPERNGIVIGVDCDHRSVYLEPHRGGVLIAGQSGIGKSTLATALTEKMVEKDFEFCVFDPEGDYTDLEHALVIGDAETPPKEDEALALLRKAGANVVINTQALDSQERPSFFSSLLPQVAALRARTGRPHWLIIDEAHHLMPTSQEALLAVLPKDIPAAILITVHPEAVSSAVLKTVETVVALGDKAAHVLCQFSTAIGAPAISGVPQPGADEVVVWRKQPGTLPLLVTPISPEQAHKRHSRKYAIGNLGEDLSFYFRGPENVLNLRAQNLAIFQQIAEGIDDRTWEHHLRAGDYSRWFRTVIKDDELAEEVRAIETNEQLDPTQSRSMVCEAVSRRYTTPAQAAES